MCSDISYSYYAIIDYKPYRAFALPIVLVSSGYQ
jgi:hypothetical protein